MGVNTPKPVVSVPLADLTIGGGARIVRGGPAIQVRCVTGQGIEGGAALPVYALSESDARENGGDYLVLGNEPIIVQVIEADAGRPQRGGHVFPVYPVDDAGEYDSACFGEAPTPPAAEDALLLESGDYLLLETGDRLLLE